MGVIHRSHARRLGVLGTIHDVAISESRWNQDFYGLAHEFIGRIASQDSDLFAYISNPTIFVDNDDLVR
jgi:hypothetical protein